MVKWKEFGTACNHFYTGVVIVCVNRFDAIRRGFVAQSKKFLKGCNLNKRMVVIESTHLR